MLPNRYLISDRGIPRVAMSGDGPSLNLKDTALTTAGAGTLLAALFSSGFILRTGPGAAVADTLDTGVNFDAAYPLLTIGDSFDAYYSNNVAFAITITAAAGMTLVTAAANNIVAANTGRLLHFEKTGVGTYDVYVI